MTLGEFVEETSKLEKYYGKELDEFQRKIWNEEIGKMSAQRYRQIIKEVFRTCKFMPKLADIVEINKGLGYHIDNKKQIEKVDCNKCNGEGFIIYTKLIDNGNIKIPYDYVARCNCENGNQYVYDGRIIQDTEHRSNYCIPSVAELGF